MALDNLMRWVKMIKLIIVLLSSSLLFGCVEIITYRESYTIDQMAYWENKITNKKASIDILNACYDASNIHTNTDIKNKYAECLYNMGYIFKTSSWLYCYHKKENCNIYNRYRK